ncbi:MAG: threonine synthase, partial [Candidatus Thermoplasmatota archaeon]|nr:threonine synthase [Candidatus Thermoplasmatota archaeon]
MGEEKDKKDGSGDSDNGEISELFHLLDGATPQHPQISPELEPARRIARDRSLSLWDRLEAFEDILETEVGDTNLTRARNIEREFGLRQLYLKFDGGNPTGTQKDRIAFAQVKDAM